MAEPYNHITAFDCLPFDNEVATADVLEEFILSQSKNVFWFSSDYKSDDDSKLAEYDYRNNNWTAGRFVGEAIYLRPFFPKRSWPSKFDRGRTRPKCAGIGHRRPHFDRDEQPQSGGFIARSGRESCRAAGHFHVWL